MKNKYTDATNERKWNYVFLLHARYKGSFPRLARAMGIPQAELKNWDAEYKQDVMQWIENEKVQLGLSSPDEEQGPVPDKSHLIEKLMRKLGTSIDSETDPSKLSRTLEILQQMQDKEGAGNSNKGSCATVTQAIEERLKKGGNNE